MRQIVAVPSDVEHVWKYLEVGREKTAEVVRLLWGNVLADARFQA